MVANQTSKTVKKNTTGAAKTAVSCSFSVGNSAGMIIVVKEAPPLPPVACCSVALSPYASSDSNSTLKCGPRLQRSYGGIMRRLVVGDPQCTQGYW
jgi:hypothetical protein